MALAPSRANTSPGWLFVAGLPDPSSPGHPFNDFGIDAQEPLVAINPDHIVQLSD